MDDYVCLCGHEYDDHNDGGEGAGCDLCDCIVFEGDV